MMCFAVSVPCFGYDGLTAIGATGGYSSMLREGSEPPLLLNGGSFGLEINHRLDRRFFVGAGFGFDFQPSFITYEAVVVDDDDEPYLAWSEQGRVKGSNLKTLSLQLGYALDIMRIIPYIAVGVIGVHESRVFKQLDDEASSRISEFVLGGRLDLGADYFACPYLALGIAIHNDVYFLGKSDFQSRFAVLFKLSFVLDVGKFGIRLADW